MGFLLDENGKISDDDAIYEKLDKWHDDDDFDSIISAVLDVPREQWSNTFHFRLISAYNNKKDFAAATEELIKIRPLCETPRDLAKFHYMNGYMNFMSDREMLAFSYYKLGLEADPQNTSGLDLEKECRECLDYIEEDLAELHSVSAEAAEKIKARCEENPDKLEVSEPVFALLLGYLFSLRVLSGMKSGISIDNFFKEFEGEEREACLKCLDETYKITSRETLTEFVRKGRYCNLAMMANDSMATLSGNPRFDTNILDQTGKQVFENTVTFVSAFAEYLPKAGVLAWDINERNGLLRYSYACGILTREEYIEGMIALSELAKENFGSAEEYVRSLIFGCALYAFDTDRWNIRGAVDFLKKMMDIMLHSILPDTKWKKPEKRG